MIVECWAPYRHDGPFECLEYFIGKVAEPGLGLMVNGDFELVLRVQLIELGVEEGYQSICDGRRFLVWN